MITAVTPQTKLDSNVSNGELMVAGYNLYRSDQSRHGGGVCLYVSNCLCGTVKEWPEFKSTILSFRDLEAVLLEMEISPSKRCVVGLFTSSPPPLPGWLTYLPG